MMTFPLKNHLTEVSLSHYLWEVLMKFWLNFISKRDYDSVEIPYEFHLMLQQHFVLKLF